MKPLGTTALWHAWAAAQLSGLAARAGEAAASLVAFGVAIRTLPHGLARPGEPNAVDGHVTLPPPPPGPRLRGGPGVPLSGP